MECEALRQADQEAIDAEEKMGWEILFRGIEMTPAEVFPPGEYLEAELEARGWTTRQCAERMGTLDVDVNTLALDMLIHCARDKRLLMGDEMATGLSRALGTSVAFWLNLEKAWRA